MNITDLIDKLEILLKVANLSLNKSKSEIVTHWKTKLNHMVDNIHRSSQPVRLLRFYVNQNGISWAMTLKQKKIQMNYQFTRLNDIGYFPKNSSPQTIKNTIFKC